MPFTEIIIVNFEGHTEEIHCG